MAKYVLKFGGTSLKDADAVKRAFSIINDFYDKNKPEQLVVVASAAGKIGDDALDDKITNLLENIYNKEKISSNKNEIISRTSKLCETLRLFHFCLRRFFLCY